MIEKDSEKYKIKIDKELEINQATREQRRKQYKELKAKIDADREARRIAREKDKLSYEVSREARIDEILVEREEKFAKIAAEKDVWVEKNHSYSDVAKQRVEAERNAWLAKEASMREERQKTIDRLQAKQASGDQLTPMEKFELNNCLAQAKSDAKKLKKEAKSSKASKKEVKAPKKKDKKEKISKKDHKVKDNSDDLDVSIDDLFEEE